MDLDDETYEIEVEAVDDLSESRFEEILRETGKLEQGALDELDREDYVEAAKHGVAAYVGTVALVKVADYLG